MRTSLFFSSKSRNALHWCQSLTSPERYRGGSRIHFLMRFKPWMMPSFTVLGHDVVRGHTLDRAIMSVAEEASRQFGASFFSLSRLLPCPEWFPIGDVDPCRNVPACLSSALAAAAASSIFLSSSSTSSTGARVISPSSDMLLTASLLFQSQSSTLFSSSFILLPPHHAPPPDSLPWGFWSDPASHRPRRHAKQWR